MSDRVQELKQQRDAWKAAALAYEDLHIMRDVRPIYMDDSGHVDRAGEAIAKARRLEG